MTKFFSFQIVALSIGNRFSFAMIMCLRCHKNCTSISGMKNWHRTKAKKGEWCCPIHGPCGLEGNCSGFGMCVSPDDDQTAANAAAPSRNPMPMVIPKGGYPPADRTAGAVNGSTPAVPISTCMAADNPILLAAPTTPTRAMTWTHIPPPPAPQDVRSAYESLRSRVTRLEKDNEELIELRVRIIVLETKKEELIESHNALAARFMALTRALVENSEHRLDAEFARRGENGRRMEPKSKDSRREHVRSTSSRHGSDSHDDRRTDDSREDAFRIRRRSRSRGRRDGKDAEVRALMVRTLRR